MKKETRKGKKKEKARLDLPQRISRPLSIIAMSVGNCYKGECSLCQEDPRKCFVNMMANFRLQRARIDARYRENHRIVKDKLDYAKAEQVEKQRKKRIRKYQKQRLVKNKMARASRKNNRKS